MYKTPMAKAREASRPVHLESAKVMLRCAQVAASLAPLVTARVHDSKSLYRKVVDYVTGTH